MSDQTARLRRAATLARHHRQALGLVGRVDVRSLLLELGHQVEIKRLRAAIGGLEACVIPLGSGMYRFVCDVEPSPADHPDVETLPDQRLFRQSFRLAHEYAHTVLSPSGRLRVHHHVDVGEERCCDAFAAVLLCDGLGAVRASRGSADDARRFAVTCNVAPAIVHLAAEMELLDDAA